MSKKKTMLLRPTYRPDFLRLKPRTPHGDLELGDGESHLKQRPGARKSQVFAESKLQPQDLP
jgi:hypothetical protein